MKKLNCPLVGSWVLLSLSRLLRSGPNNTPEQNPIVHQKHIFIKIIVISRFFKSRNSYAYKGGAQERLLAKRRKMKK